MAFDIRGSRKNTAVAGHKFVVLEELLSNAIDSYLIRKHLNKDVHNFSIKFIIEIIKKNILEDGELDLEITCIDNGAGMGDEQTKAFVTRDTTFKDDLDIPGIGRCKGTGRAQYFNFFERLKIRSNYLASDSSIRERSLDVDQNTKEISESSFSDKSINSEVIQTRLVLSGLTKTAIKKHFISGFDDIASEQIKKYILFAFLKRFIAIKDELGDFEVGVKVKGTDGSESEAVILPSDLPNEQGSRLLPIYCSHGNQSISLNFNLTITNYIFDETSYPKFGHDVALCANSSIVLSLLGDYLSKTHWSKPLDGKFHLVLIEGEYLENNVNNNRDGFDFPVNCKQGGDLNARIVSLEDIRDSIETYIQSIITPPDFDRNEIVKSVENRYGIPSSLLEEKNIKIHIGDNEETVTKRVLKKIQEDIVEETSGIFDMKEELNNIDPKSDEFREKIRAISWKYTTTIKKLDMANLSQLVVRRAAMLEVLKKASDQLLSIQLNNEGRKENEALIHSIFFPMKKDSDEVSDHDIWILNEEYHYFNHIASDKALSTIPWDKGEKLFDSDVDTVVEAFLQKNYDENKAKRPDIAIFNTEGSAIIIEFKAPGVSLDRHIGDLQEYANLLAAKSKGRIKRFYGYLIGDVLNKNRMSGYKKFPSNTGYFGTFDVLDPESDQRLGELHSEVIFYKDIISRAENRLKVYKEKLGLDFS